jgi:RNA polymerase sigma factor (TIGR02999 family)
LQSKVKARFPRRNDLKWHKITRENPVRAVDLSWRRGIRFDTVAIMSEITLLLDAISRGESRASEDLLPLIYDELRRLAAARMAGEAAGQTLQPTALVHEAWLRLVNEGGRTWRNRAHFFRAAAQAMRRILVDRARQKLSIKRGSGGEKIPIDDMDLAAATVDDRVLLVDQNLERLEKEDPESARVITLKFFGGLTNKEVAKILNVTERSVERQWAYAKTCLFEMIQAEI